jgi:hypothetical protein
MLGTHGPLVQNDRDLKPLSAPDGTALGAMNPDQLARVRRVNQPMFVLDAAATTRGLRCVISGSTGTPYDLAVNGSSVKCSCPDARNRRDLVCKHMCFLAIRVGGASPAACTRRALDAPTLARVTQRLLVNADWHPSPVPQLPQPPRVQPSQPPRVQPPAPRIQPSQPPRVQPEPRDPLAECPVCYETLSTSKELFVCGTCRNGVHRACWDRWRAFNRARRCIMCRAAA